MITKLSIFQKLFYFLLFMVAIFVIAFWYINSLNLKVIQTEVNKNKMNDMRFITSQLTTQFEQVLMNTMTLSQDSTVRSFPEAIKSGDRYARYENKIAIMDKLALNSASTTWNNTVILYYPNEKEMISSVNSFSFSSFKLPDDRYHEWTIHMENPEAGYYSYIMRSPFSVLLIEVRISLENITKMVEQYNSGTPLLYDSAQNTFITKDSGLLQDAYPAMAQQIQGLSGSFSLRDQGTAYVVNYMKSDELDLYFIDYHPKSQYTQQISRNNQYFLYAVLMVLGGVICYTLLLRKQVQQPVQALRTAINRFDRGDLSSRVDSLDANEFSVLGNSFNRMAENTQRLIEQVLLIEIEVKEAKLRQYQAQINPHFLFNCLNYIQSKASVKDHESVTAMTLHLGSYCRYIHKIELVDATLMEEFTFVKHFLSIVQLRKREIAFDIHISESLYDERVPRMILQPLVENCVKHGIEPGMQSGIVSIRTEPMKHGFEIVIEDNGVGMTEERTLAIQRHMDDVIPQDGALGAGIRNVHQRLRLYYGKNSGLIIESTPFKGTCYRIQIQKGDDEHAADFIG
ncbi:integral membrane sensor signal transduction histidine kinase [Paenibacillus algicola]|uniref:Integral membrane sensor signal transduction histidine kinase n=1 Tax=Paenibacillus algicola TaxID=2565926 RepID=A0A4P8XHX2_9BACL|nr:histidine kinase [Paenibacillus algicola]QCT01040.1 integral membrane sensor signal transduction histidine kinase [Paenibacillus algicola]